MIPQPATPNQVKSLLSGREPQTDFVMSPSQIDKFLSCERAAGLEYIDGFREEGNQDAQRLGTRVHDILERFVKTGERPDLLETMQVGARVAYPGQIADAAICLIPPGAVAESELRMTRPNGIVWTGKRDLRVPGPVPEVRDYKTTSDFKYMAEKDLATDTQAVVYACAELTEHPENNQVHLHWQFLRTKGKPDSKSLRLVVDRAHVGAQMARIDAIAERWVSLRKKGARGEIRGADLEPTGAGKGTCDKFLGCPYRGSRCILTPEQLLRSAKYEREGTMDIAAKLAEMAQKQTAIGNVPAPAAFAGIPAPAPAPVQTTRPSFWMPGDPMNEDQAYFHSKGKPLSFIAGLADVRPPDDVAATYDKAVQAPVENGFVNGPAPGAPTLAAINPTAAAAFVNGVPAPAPAPAPAPEAAPQPGAPLDRNALKAEAVRRGLVSSSSRMGAEGLLKLLQTGAKEIVSEPTHSLVTSAFEQGAPFPAPAPAAIPAPSALPAPAGARFDDATLDAIADRVVARLKAALLGAL